MKAYQFFVTIKAKHYIKNLIILLPLLFSMEFISLHLWIRELLMIISFCMISSAVYVMNDLVDKEKDKLHPVKSLRPIAHGDITDTQAYGIMFMLLISGSALAYHLSLICFVTVIAYFLFNILYSFFLKRFAIVDIASIAFGFILRIIAGCFVISAIPSPLVILMTFFVSMFFTSMKRRLEIQILAENLKDGRDAIKELDLNTISQFILINAVLSISFYFTYTLDSTTIQRAGTSYLYLTSLPFTLIMYRLFLLVNTKKIFDDPMHYIEQDKTLKWLFLLFIAVLILVLTVLK